MSRFNLFLTWIVYLFSVIETSIFLSTKHVTLGRKKLVSLRILFAFIYPCSDTTLDFYITRFSLSITCGFTLADALLLFTATHGSCRLPFMMSCPCRPVSLRFSEAPPVAWRVHTDLFTSPFWSR